MNKVIVIYGPTAIGKSDIAISLAKKINAEIISADSMHIYEDLNIGSAKVTQEEMQGVVHHLINIKKCNENYSVAEFVNDCKNCISKIKAQDKNVIIVGGTGLYIKALTENYNYGQVDKNTEFRKNYENLSNKELCEKLKDFNYNVTANDKNNRRRLLRYLEIYSNNGKIQKNEPSEEYIIFGLCDDREKIYNRINRRVDKMISEGLIEETKYLLSKSN